MRHGEVGAGLEQRGDELRITGPARLKERRDAVVIRRVDGAACGDERARHLEIGVVGGPEQRGRPIIRSDIDVGALGHQSVDFLMVLVPGSLDKPEVAGRNRNARHQAFGTGCIDNGAARHLPQQSDHATDRQHQADLALGPFLGRQVDRDERTETRLDVGEEEDEPVETAQAGAR